MCIMKFSEQEMQEWIVAVRTAKSKHMKSHYGTPDEDESDIEGELEQYQLVDKSPDARFTFSFWFTHITRNNERFAQSLGFLSFDLQ